ncbi:tRNA lysidine(34) synthetase TilS [Caldalkalibacillus uzonensis]|uniref:tRNA lysidine(34) synthetase TilS n=1 Tax=Caldalkalibacillus uzonensis TaxID=353224 RepID=UPI0027D8C191|nr:tRNA lysidine(34) synthetase TilS [Caldalkalibacillus uzonensis]
MTTIKEYQLLVQGDRILVAVSGGPDSMMLLHWLWRFKTKWGLELIAVHLNHQLRGRDADLDQAYVEKMCATWGIPCVAEKRDVARYAQENSLSKQVAARECRYALFEQVARLQKCNKVAVAHHADDQVETVLMRLIRGTGPAGLSGMRPKRALAEFHSLTGCELIRPLLALSKREIERYCQVFELNPRLDHTNLTDDDTRNWIRHHLVPKMKELNPNLSCVIQDMSHLVAEDDDYLTELAKQKVDHIIDQGEDQHIRLKLPELRQLPLPLQRRVILLLLNYLSGDHHWKKVHIDSILKLAKREAGHQKLYLPEGINVERHYDLLLVHKRGPTHTDPRFQFCYEISAPGTYQWAELPFSLIIEKRPRNLHRPVDRGKQENAQGDIYQADFDAADLHFPLLIRNRRAGDKMQPLGMKGHKKVKDIFIDSKIPRYQRELWPIILDQQGVLWIPGLKRSDRAKVTEQTQELYVLTMKMREGFWC